MYEGCLYYVPANRGKNFEVGKKVSSPPLPAHQLFGDLRDFIGWQRTAVACLTLNPHPMLAALPKSPSYSDPNDDLDRSTYMYYYGHQKAQSLQPHLMT